MYDSTKLTVRVPRNALNGAKRYAREQNTTLTRLISSYLQRLSIQDDPMADAPIVQRLSGSLSPEVKETDYKHYLEEKYGQSHHSPD